MATKKSETKFVPCVARHFTSKTVSYGKMLEAKLVTLEEQIARYDGDKDPQIVEALAELRAATGPVQDAVLALARIMDAQSSQPEGF